MKFLLVIMIALWAAPTLAQDSGPDYARVGSYGSVGYGIAIEDFDDGTNLDIGDSSFVDIRAGYRVHPNLSFEVQGSLLDDFDFDGQQQFVNGLLTVDGSFDGWTLGANAKVYALTDRIQPYGLLGIGMLDGEAEAKTCFTEDLFAFDESDSDSDYKGADVIVVPGETECRSFKDDTTKFIWTAGAGVDFYVTPNVAVEIEAARVFQSDWAFWRYMMSLVWRF